jgi:hypothetical protein
LLFKWNLNAFIHDLNNWSVSCYDVINLNFMLIQMG